MKIFRTSSTLGVFLSSSRSLLGHCKFSLRIPIQTSKSNNYNLKHARKLKLSTFVRLKSVNPNDEYGHA